LFSRNSEPLRPRTSMSACQVSEFREDLDPALFYSVPSIAERRDASCSLGDQVEKIRSATVIPGHGSRKPRVTLRQAKLLERNWLVNMLQPRAILPLRKLMFSTRMASACHFQCTLLSITSCLRGRISRIEVSRRLNISRSTGSRFGPFMRLTTS